MSHQWTPHGFKVCIKRTFVEISYVGLSSESSLRQARSCPDDAFEALDDQDDAFTCSPVLEEAGSKVSKLLLDCSPVDELDTDIDLIHCFDCVQDICTSGVDHIGLGFQQTGAETPCCTLSARERGDLVTHLNMNCCVGSEMLECVKELNGVTSDDSSSILGLRRPELDVDLVQLCLPTQDDKDAHYEVESSSRFEDIASVAAQDKSRGGRRSARRSQALRLRCHLFLDPIMLDSGFALVKKIIGRNGCNTWNIFQDTNTKVRVRGKGSGHRECNGREAPVPLMVALSADHENEEDFRKAFEQTRDLLKWVCKSFKQYRQRNRQSAPVAKLFWFGDLSESAKIALSDYVDELATVESKYYW